MSFSAVSSRGRLLRFLVDQIGTEISSGSVAGSGSFVAVSSSGELVLAGTPAGGGASSTLQQVCDNGATTDTNITTDGVIVTAADGTDNGGLYIGDSSPYLSFYQEADCYQMAIGGTGYSTRKRIRLGRDDGNNIVQIPGSASIGVDASSDSYDPGCPLEVRMDSSTGAECIRMRANHASGDPYISWYSQGTRNCYIQMVTPANELRLTSEYGPITFYTADDGSEVERLSISDAGLLTSTQGSMIFNTAGTDTQGIAGAISWYQSNGTTRGGFVGFSSAGHEHLLAYNQTPTGSFSIYTNATLGLTVDYQQNTTLAGNITLSAATSYIKDASGDNRIQISDAGSTVFFNADGDQEMFLSDGYVFITGDLWCNGNTIKDNGGNSAITFDGSGNTTIAGALTVGDGDLADGGTLLTFDCDRAWAFKQSGNGSGAALMLQNTVGPNKDFIIKTNGETRFYDNDGVERAVIDNDTGDMQLDGDLTVGGSIVQSSWTAVSYATGWADYSVGYLGVSYMKDSLGFIHIRGMAKKTSGTADLVFTLAAGYRPANRLIFSVQYYDASVGYVDGRADVETDGKVTIEYASTPAVGDWVSFGAINFDTQAEP